MKEVRVLMVGWELPPFASGGLGTVSYFLARALGRLADVTFTLPDDVPVSIEGVRVVKLPSSLSRFSAYHVLSKEYPLLGTNDFMRKVFQYADQMLEYFATHAFRFDVIHAHDYLTFFAGFALRKRYGVPLVLHVHATEIDRTGNRPNQSIYDLERFAMQHADRIITVSDYERQVITSHYGIGEERITVIPHGAPDETDTRRRVQYLEALKRDGYRIVLFVGRMTIQKGADYLIRAAPLVVERAPKTVFVLVGDGDMLPQLVKASFDLGIYDNVIFTGWLDKDKEVGSLYALADVFVMPSVSEPFGYVALEAAKHGVPLIVSKTSGVEGYVNHKLSVDFWDVRELANKILGVLEFPELHRELTQNVSRELPKFSWDTVAQSVLAVYRELIAT